MDNHVRMYEQYEIQLVRMRSVTYTASMSWFDAARERMFSSDLGSPSSKASMASTSSAAGSVEPTLRMDTVELGTR